MQLATPFVHKPCPKCKKEMDYIPVRPACSECSQKHKCDTAYWICLKCNIVEPIRESEKND